MADSDSAGGCLCGAIRYRLTAPLARIHLCHCRTCQKATGSAFSSCGAVPKDAFVLTRGTLKEYRSSAPVRRGFCAACGTPLTFRHEDHDTIGIALGSLDRPELLALEYHTGIESRLPWLHFDDGLPERETPAG